LKGLKPHYAESFKLVLLFLIDFIIHSGYLRAFCHLKPERSFLYDDQIQALLCHRCSAIYSGFLIFFILLKLACWNGQWTNKKSKSTGFIIAIMMISLSVLQVGYEEAIGKAWITSNGMRFCIGAYTGFGIFLFMQLSEENNKMNKNIPGWIIGIGSLIIVIIHYILSSGSFLYSAITTIAGLITLYIIMNTYVLLSFFPKLKYKFISVFVVVMVAAEWILLYLYNTSNHV
jgi:uncharacterized membrane protein